MEFVLAAFDLLAALPRRGDIDPDSRRIAAAGETDATTTAVQYVPVQTGRVGGITDHWGVRVGVKELSYFTVRMKNGLVSAEGLF